MVEFNDTMSLVTFMQSVGATDLAIQQGEKKIPYVAFNNSSKTTCLLSKKIDAVTPANAGSLEVSYIEGTDENGVAVKGYLLHRVGTVEVLSTFSLSDVAAI